MKEKKEEEKREWHDDAATGYCDADFYHGGVTLHARLDSPHGQQGQYSLRWLASGRRGDAGVRWHDDLKG